MEEDSTHTIMRQEQLYDLKKWSQSYTPRTATPSTSEPRQSQTIPPPQGSSRDTRRQRSDSEGAEASLSVGLREHG